MPDLSADDLIARLGLAPLPWEGGYYRETWRASVAFADGALPGAYDGPRDAGTAIYYLLTPDTLSKLHRLPSDEVFHFYLGDPVDLTLLGPDGGAQTHVLGSDLMGGQHVQFVVPGNTWFGARLSAGATHGYALMGTTVAPGFDFKDLEIGDADALIAEYPDAAAIIRALT